MLQAPLPQGRSRSDTYPVNMYACAKLVKRIIENEMLNGEEIQLDGAIRLTPK